MHRIENALTGCRIIGYAGVICIHAMCPCFGRAIGVGGPKESGKICKVIKRVVEPYPRWAMHCIRNNRKISKDFLPKPYWYRNRKEWSSRFLSVHASGRADIPWTAAISWKRIISSIDKRPPMVAQFPGDIAVAIFLNNAIIMLYGKWRDLCSVDQGSWPSSIVFLFLSSDIVYYPEYR